MVFIREKDVEAGEVRQGYAYSGAHRERGSARTIVALEGGSMPRGRSHDVQGSKRGDGLGSDGDFRMFIHHRRGTRRLEDICPFSFPMH